MTWADVNLATGYIQVSPQVAKTRRSRRVTIQDNLRTWITSHQGQYPHQTDDLLCPPYVTLRKKRAKIARACGLAKWPVDVMRHCFATYHLESFGIDATIREMGHTNSSMLYDHYRGLSSKTDATEFWEIVPEDDVNLD